MDKNNLSIGVCLDDLNFPPEYFELIGLQGDCVILRSLEDPDSEPLIIDSKGFWKLT
jgi:hypothetical protein